MALDPQQRRALRSLQLCLDSSLPSRLLDNVSRNDLEAWGALTMLEVRMLIARGQTYQARQLGSRLSTALAAGLPVDRLDAREYALLINGIDAVQAGRHYLAQLQLSRVTGSVTGVIQWAARIWQARSLGAVGELGAAGDSAVQGVQAAEGLPEDARHWAACFEAEVQARAGEAAAAEERVLRSLSYFVGQGDPRGESFAYLYLARIGALAGREEESAATGELSYRTDGSWTGPPLLLAHRALVAGDREKARKLLSSIPSPTTDAYLLQHALETAEPRGITLQAILRYLDLTDAPAHPEVIDDLQRLLDLHPRFVQAREALFWKLLYRGQIKEAEQHAEAMVNDAAHATSVVAVRFGLQTFHEQSAPALQQMSRAVSPASRVTGPLPQVAPPAPAKPSGGFTGQLSLFSVPDLLQFLCGSGRTGLLTFSCQRGDATIRMHNGSLCWGTSPEHSSIVAFLADRQVITLPADASMADDVTALCQGEGVNLEALADALRESLRLTIKRAADWSDGWFMFDRSGDATPPPPELLFNAQGVLLDALRELDEERR
jgi:hypothetical protein